MSNFEPVLWQEEPVPLEFRDCLTCGLYKHGTRMVWGEGNPEAPILILLDNPGAREDKEGRPFVCGTRQTLQTALHESGLSMEVVYVTYILKRRPTRAYDKETVRETCRMTHLTWQLKTKQPRLIVCLGNIAVQAFFQDPTAEVKVLRGKPYDVQNVPTFVAYHPLAVRRRPNLMKLFLQDWQEVTSFYRALN